MSEGRRNSESYRACSSRTECFARSRKIDTDRPPSQVRKAFADALKACRCPWWRDHLTRELALWRRDLRPVQCRLGRLFLGWDVHDLEDVSATDEAGPVEAYDIKRFEAGDPTANLTICERVQLWEAFRKAGVTFSHTAQRVIRIDRSLSARLTRQHARDDRE